MAIYSRLSIQSTNCRWFRIRGNKCTTQLINNKPDIDKIYLYAKDTYEAKYQCLINKRQKVGLDHFNNPKAFFKYPNDMQDVYQNIANYNPGKKHKILTVFEGMVADMINN